MDKQVIKARSTQAGCGAKRVKHPIAAFACPRAECDESPVTLTSRRVPRPSRQSAQQRTICVRQMVLAKKLDGIQKSCAEIPMAVVELVEPLLDASVRHVSAISGEPFEPATEPRGID